MAGQSASFDDQDDANASFIKNQEHGVKKLSDEIAGMLESLNPPSASSPKHCCIYKVSDHIRKSNEEAYTPQVISIGPYHRNNPKLQTMESFKLSYLKSFKEPRAPKMNLEHLVRAIKGAEESVRECYSETIPLESDDFVKMILVDASFIIQYFWKNTTKIWTEYDREILEPGLCNRMLMDLILLENQLPFFIIEKIYEIAFPSFSKQHPFIELTFRQFEYYNVQEFVHQDPDRDSGSSEISILHFTDLLRNFCMPPGKGPRPKESSALRIKQMHSATQLDEIGLKFKMSNNRSPLELKYADGVLEIPRFQLDDTTEIYARNLLALEKCHYPYKDEAYITDYYTFLSFLIRTGKDLDVLVREQIIDNWLDSAVATSMINKLSGENDFYYQMNSHYHEMAQALNEFYNKPPPQLNVAPLQRDYFPDPWKGAATIGAILLLLLTVIQTVCALISVKNWK